MDLLNGPAVGNAPSQNSAALGIAAEQREKLERIASGVT